MADKIKNYGITGTAANIQLGKQGPIISGANANVIVLTDASSNAAAIITAEGTENSHAVTKSQLDLISANKLQYQNFTVSYDDLTVPLANALVNTRIYHTVIDPTSTWTGADNNTTITVGDAGDTDRLFTAFDPEFQTTDEMKHKYTANTIINAYVSAGSAVAGNARITIWYTGTLNPPPEGPTYSIAPSDDRFINEGNAVTLNVTTTNVGSNTLYWSVSHITTANSDFVAVNGTVSISNDSGSFTITTVEDFATEGNETFAVQLRTDSISGNIVATTANLTVSDSSRNVTVTANNNSVNEGNAVVFTVTTDNFGTGTLYYTVEGISFDGVVRGAVNTDFEGNVLPSGNVNIVDDSGTVTVTTRADVLTEGAEGFRLLISKDSIEGTVIAASANVTINDTSRPQYDITAAANTVNEGESLTFNVTTLNVANQTLRFRVGSNTSINALNTTTSADFDNVGGVNPFSSYVNFSLVDNAGTFTVPIRNDLISSTGSTWSAASATAANTWRSVAYGAGVWVAVANDGTDQIMRSTNNGASWTPVAAAEANQWFSVATDGAGVWIAVSQNGTNRVMRSADNGLTWTPVGSVAGVAANTWYSVAYGDGVWVAVASGGTNRAMRSTDGGLTWTALGTSDGVVDNPWHSVAYGDNVWIAVANNGTNRVMRSTNGGANWTAIGTGAGVAANSWLSVAYGDGVWVAVANGGTNRVIRSINGGANWTTASAAQQNDWRSVAYGAGVWVAVSFDGTNRVMRSTNGGAIWAAVAAAEQTNWHSVAYGGGMWVAVSTGGTNRVMRSSLSQGFHVDIASSGSTTVLARSEVITIVEPPIYTITPAALTVDEGESLAFTVSADDLGVHAANNTLRFTVLSNTSTALNAVTATDFDTVNGVNPFSTPVEFNMVNNVGTFTVPIRSDLVTSSGSTWTAASAATANDWYSVAYGDGVWVAVSFGGTNRAMRSTNDGASWTALGTGDGVAANNWMSVAYGAGVWVAVSRSGTNRVMRSTNGGVSWTGVAATEANQWDRVAYGDGVWIAVATTGTNRVMRSTNGGASWTAVAAAEANTWGSVAYGDGVWIAVASGGDNRIMRSTDGGVTWTAVAATEANTWISVAYGEGVWVATSFDGTNRVMRSTDAGLTWTAVAAAEAASWYSVAYGQGVWIAVSPNAITNRVMRSTNGGVTWTAVTAAEVSSWFSVAYGAGMWVSVASAGTNRVMRSSVNQGFHVDILPQNTTALQQRSAVITIVDQSAATITANANTVNEDANITFTVATDDFGSGTLYWTAIGIGAAAANVAADLIQSSGTVTITDNSGTLVISTVADLTTEGNEQFAVQLRTDSATGNIVATSEIITIVDTSAPTPTFAVAPAANTVNEGSNVTFTVTTTDFGSGTLYWTTGGTASNADFVANSGNVTVTADTGSFIITTAADLTTEGSETFFVQLRTDSISGNIVATSSNVTIEDTSTTPLIDSEFEYLVVAGGGGGGSNSAGGGGAGGFRTATGFEPVIDTAYTVTVGGGGAGQFSNTLRGFAGSSSVFDTVTASGGGGGGGIHAFPSSEPNGGSGGSGGGGGSARNLNPAGAGGTGTAGQGNNGGAGGAFTTDANGTGGGGGGAGGAGGAGGGEGTGGAGGAGSASSITGSSVTYAGGGGGGGFTGGAAGTGGGGAGASNTVAGVAGGTNTGGGGGGASNGLYYTGAAAGGSGVVIIRYHSGGMTATGGTITTDGDYKVHTFTSSGTFTRTA